MLFGFKDVDMHYMIYFLGISLKIKHKLKNIEQRHVTEYGLNTSEGRNPRIVVSLTTFPDRINKVHITIEHLLTQTVKPDKLILWLAEEQFQNKEGDLPESLLRLCEFGLSIKWCKDLKSYKKLLPTLKEYPDDIIITYDDDFYYDENSIELLYNEYLKNPKNIYAHRGSRVYFKDGDLKVYTGKYMCHRWDKYAAASLFNTLIGCGGVLYPPKCLDERVLDEKVIAVTIPTQDDVWFWAMALLKGTKIQVVNGYSKSLISIEGTQQYGLCKINSSKGRGMSAGDAITCIVKKYPELIELLNS